MGKTGTQPLAKTAPINNNDLLSGRDKKLATDRNTGMPGGKGVLG